MVGVGAADLSLLGASPGGYESIRLPSGLNLIALMKWLGPRGRYCGAKVGLRKVPDYRWISYHVCGWTSRATNARWWIQ
eukprot:3203550-Amphidinium_carterae.1